MKTKILLIAGAFALGWFSYCPKRSAEVAKWGCPLVEASDGSIRDYGEFDAKSAIIQASNCHTWFVSPDYHEIFEVTSSNSVTIHRDYCLDDDDATTSCNFNGCEYVKVK